MTAKHMILAIVIASLQIGYARGEDLNPVVGKAGDIVLREADLERLLSSQPPEVQKAVQSDVQQRAGFIRQFLMIKAVAAKSRKDGFDKKPEVRELVSNLVDQYLAQEYMDKVVTANVTITEDELKAYYSENEKEFLLPESVKVRQIFISLPEGASQKDKERVRAQAEKVLQMVQKGENFEKLAKEYSEDVDSAAKGGDLGLVTPGKTNSPEFEKAVFSLKAGEISGIVETPFGYHIIKADERKESRKVTFDEARNYIQNIVKEQNRQKAAEQFLEKLTKEMKLEVIGEKQVAPPKK